VCVIQALVRLRQFGSFLLYQYQLLGECHTQRVLSVSVEVVDEMECLILLDHHFIGDTQLPAYPFCHISLASCYQCFYLSLIIEKKDLSGIL